MGKVKKTERKSSKEELTLFNSEIYYRLNNLKMHMDIQTNIAEYKSRNRPPTFVNLECHNSALNGKWPI